MTGRDFLLPDLGEGLTEAEIVAWLVAPGDTITIDQPVIEVESAKSIVELPSPFGGVVGELFGEVGQVVHAGQVLLTVTDAAAPASTSPAKEPAIAAAPATTEPAIAEPANHEASGAVLIGYGTRDGARPLRKAAAGRFGATATVSAPSAAPAPGPTPASTASAAAAAEPGVVLLDPSRRSPVVSPLVRRMARENGFDASALAGSGRDSLVLRRDVEAYIRDHEAPVAPPVAPTVAPPPTTTIAPAPTTGAATAAAGPDMVADDIRIPLTGEMISHL